MHLTYSSRILHSYSIAHCLPVNKFTRTTRLRRLFASNGEESLSDYKQVYRSFLELLHLQGHFVADPHVHLDAVQRDRGASKRAILSFGRSRPDLLRKLDSSKVERLLAAGLPQKVDRKTKNAHQRLLASIIKKQDLGPGDGGAAETQDILRLYIELDSSADLTAAPQLLPAALALLPDIQAEVPNSKPAANINVDKSKCRDPKEGRRFGAKKMGDMAWWDRNV